MPKKQRPQPQVPVGQGHGQGVGGVGRLGLRGQAELPLHGRLHLLLAGMAAAGEHALDAIGQVMMHGQPRLGPRQADHAAGMAQQDRRLGEPGMGEDLLDRHRRRA